MIQLKMECKVNRVFSKDGQERLGKCSPFLDIREMQIKITLRLNLIPLKMVKIIKQMTADAGKDAGKGDTYSFLLGMKTGTASMEISSTFIREASLIKTEFHNSTVCRD